MQQLNRHPISPLIYGVAFANSNQLADLNFALNRLRRQLGDTANFQTNSDFQAAWIQHLTNIWSLSTNGGVRIRHKDAHDTIASRGFTPEPVSDQPGRQRNQGVASV